MITNVVFLGILLTWCLWGGLQYNKKFEEILPLSIMGIILTLFFFGVLGILKYGVLFVILLSCGILLISLYRIVVTKNIEIRSVFHNILTPPFAIFCIIYFVLNQCDYGLLAHGWDEFSHWMDSVKAMTDIDDFVSNPASNSAFQSYPPAMALIQYFFQKVYLTLNPGNGFSEWRVYLAYQLTIISLVFPFLKNLSYKNPLEIILTGIIVFTIPLPFYAEIYSSVYIDPFVGMLAGCGFLAVLFAEKRSIYSLVYITCICMILVLAKDVGMYFACFVAVAYFLSTQISTYKDESGVKKLCERNGMVHSVIPIICTIMIKLIWKNELSRSGAKIIFGEKIDILAFTEMFFLRNDATVNQTIVENFKWAFFRPSFLIGGTDLSISYFSLMIITVLYSYMMYQKIKFSFPERRLSLCIIESLLFVQLIFYIYCLGATYISTFSESEGLGLASYERYINIGFLTTWVVLVIGTLLFIQKDTDIAYKNTAVMCLAAALLLISPMEDTVKLLNRDCALESQNQRWEYKAMADKIHEYCSGNDDIYFVAIGDAGYSYWVSKYNARPNALGTPDWVSYRAWDMKTKKSDDLSVKEWQDILLNDYDYVAIYQVDSNFAKKYGGIFQDVDEIENQTVFFVNKKTGLLEKCG